MRKWHEEFNALPDEVRHICCGSGTITRINELKAEKGRIKASYIRQIKEVNQIIKNHEDWLMKLEKK